MLIPSNIIGPVCIESCSFLGHSKASEREHNIINNVLQFNFKTNKEIVKGVFFL